MLGSSPPPQSYPTQEGLGSRVDANCVEDKNKETTRAEFKRLWGLGTHGGNVLELPWCLEKRSAGRRGVHGLRSRVLSLLGEERSLDICGGAGHCTPRKPKPTLIRIPDRLSSGSAEGLKVQTERTRSMLLFANVSARHYGNYTCRAANRLGASSASMRLLRASVLGGGVGQGCGGCGG